MIAAMWSLFLWLIRGWAVALACYAFFLLCRACYRQAKQADHLEALKGNPPMRDRR